MVNHETSHHQAGYIVGACKRRFQQLGIECLEIQYDTAKNPLVFDATTAQIAVIVALLESAQKADKFEFMLQP